MFESQARTLFLILKNRELLQLLQEDSDLLEVLGEGTLNYDS